jgi:hypothetical protein
VVGSVLLPEVGILQWIAAGLGIGTAAAQLPDAIIEDRAVQSGRGGAQQVSSLDPDTARENNDRRTRKSPTDGFSHFLQKSLQLASSI